MKSLTILTIVFALSLAAAWPRKHKKIEYERRRIIHQHHEHRGQGKHESTTRGVKHHNSKKNAHKIFKKFGMFAPGFSLEDSSVPVAQGQGQAAFQQVLMPVSSAGFTQNTATAPQMLSSYAAAPSPRATLGTEVIGDQSTTQQVDPQAAQPQTLQFEGAPIGTNEDNSVLKTTQGATLQEAPVGTSEDNSILKSATQGATLQEAGAIPTELTGGQATAVDPSTESIQSYTQQDPGKGTDDLKDLQMYTGPLPDSGQNKPQVEGVSPQEEIKIVNLGDDEKTASLQQSQGQDHACGGCPPGAKCVNGQCQIREEDAQAQGLTGKGTANNPGSVSDIHNLETQELASLLKDASNADTPPGAVPETPTGSRMTTGNPSKGQALLQDQTPEPTIQSSPQIQKIQTEPKTAQFTKPASTQQVAQQPTTGAQPHFSGGQLKELRDFARMYKMYQFIRKMEERLNDPDCAPVCRKQCKTFCPEKCCHGKKINENVVSHMMQAASKTAGTLEDTGNKAGTVSKQHKVEAKPKLVGDPKLEGPQKVEGQQKVAPSAAGMEDNAGEHEDTEEQEEKKMDQNAAAGKKHILIRIVKNDVLDRPRSVIRETV